MKTCDETHDGGQRKHSGPDPVSEYRPKSKEERLFGSSDLRRAGRDARVEEQRKH